MASADAQMAAKLPAPATFAPSRDDVLSTLAFFFGDPAVPEKLKDYSEHHATTFHFPDAYYGQNTKIRETLNNLILKSPQDWQTNVALPFVRITGTTVEWDELRFDVRLLQRVPYEGVSRMQTSLRRRHRDRVVRRGIGMMIESDFYATEAGRSHFSDQLTSIRYCVQETCNFDCIFAYLTCGNYDFRYDMQKGLRPRRSVRTAMAHEVMFYAIAQKEGLGFDKCVEEAKSRMSRYQVTPNMLIVPPQLLLYMATAPEEKITYKEGGPSASAAFEAGVQGFESRAFRGMGVFTSVPYEVSDDQDSVQMLQRSTQVGEFYRMSPPPVWDTKKRLPPTYMDILVYDEEKDMHVHIPFKQALYATGIGGEGWQAADVFGAANLDSTALSQYNSQSNPAEDGKINAIQLNALQQKVNFAGLNDADTQQKLQSIITSVESGEWLPLEIVIARPFIEHLAMSAIMTVSGRDTGATLFGPAGARWRLSGPCTHFPSPQRSHPASRVRSQTCKSRPTRRSRRSRGAFLHLPATPAALRPSMSVFSPRNPSRDRHYTYAVFANDSRAASAPLMPSLPQQVPHEVGHHASPERHGPSRHHALGLRGGRQHPLLWRGQRQPCGSRQLGGGHRGHHDAPVVCGRRVGRVRLDAGVCGAVRRRQQARPGHLAVAPPPSVGGVAPGQ